VAADRADAVTDGSGAVGDDGPATDWADAVRDDRPVDRAVAIAHHGAAAT
jgi:hypothetical protein